ncbi:MAG: PhoH family protein [Treponema sp.]|nr:PhoH family protein [Treponema sp.]
MNSEYIIVVPDQEVLTCVCGTNDTNLKLIEDHLGIPVYTKGNELSIDTDDENLRQEFQFIVDRIIDEVNDGGKNSSDIITSVLNMEKKADMENTSITVPGCIRKVYPHTQHQADYIQSMRSHDMVFCYGAAGSGKTFLAVAEALRLVLSHQKSRLILSRPIVEAGESLGFLPGDLEQKINPYLRPLYDAMGMILSRDTVRRLVESEVIEVAPLAYMRGRTLNNSVIILDEAQNTTCEQMKMFLTRMGEGSKVFITGDITQIDLPKRVPSGLIHATNLLSGINEIGMIRLTAEDVVRNPLVKKIVKAYEYEQDKIQ